MDLLSITEAVRGHPDIQDAVVRSTTTSEGETLVLYVVPTPQAGRWGQLMANATRRLVDKTDELATELVTWRSLWSALDAASVPLIGRTLALLGAFQTPGRVADVADLVAEHGVVADHTPLLGQWLSVLADDGVLVRCDSGGYRVDHPLDPDILDAKFTALIDALAPEGVEKVFADYFRDCADHQVAIARGEVSALHMLFPGGDSTLAETFYAVNPVSRVLNHVLAESAGYLADRASPTQPLRILEIGAGTGATTATVLPRLPVDTVRYTFTDVSAYFTNHARDRFADYPFLDYSVFDLDVDPTQQGLTSHGYDVVIAANVLHTARNIEQALSKVRDLLTPDGVLLAVERTANVPTQMVTVGFLEGFSHYEDSRKAANLPLLSQVEWNKSLRAAGFGRIAALPHGAAASAELAEHLLVAEVSETNAPGATPVSPGRDLVALLPPGTENVQYIELEQIPRLPAGDVDETALPAPRGVGRG